jgi:hypothetical protein
MEDTNNYIQYILTNIPYELEPAPQPPIDIQEPLHYELEPAPQPPIDIQEPLHYEVKHISEIENIYNDIIIMY